MTVTIGDVVAGLGDQRVRALVHGAVRTVEERERRERERQAKQEEEWRLKRQAQYVAAVGACKGLLPVELQRFARLDPVGQADEPHHGLRLELEISLPGLEPTMRARFEFSSKRDNVGWQLTDYFLPGVEVFAADIEPTRGDVRLSWSRLNAVSCSDAATALANLARITAELANAREECARINAGAGNGEGRDGRTE